jgi:hypothetical protein
MPLMYKLRAVPLLGIENTACSISYRLHNSYENRFSFSSSRKTSISITIGDFILNWDRLIADLQKQHKDSEFLTSFSYSFSCARFISVYC